MSDLRFIQVDNRKTFTFLRYTVIVMLALIIADLLLGQLDGSIAKFTEGHWIAIFAFVVLVFFAFIRVNYFHYDDSYEILQIKSKSLWFIGGGADLNKRYDFPKRKVVDFEVKNRLIYRTLVLHLENYASESKKVRTIDMTFIPKKDVTKVVSSLKRITDRNRTLPKPDLAL